MNFMSGELFGNSQTPIKNKMTRKGLYLNFNLLAFTIIHNNDQHTCVNEYVTALIYSVVKKCYPGLVHVLLQLCKLWTFQ